MYKNKKRKEENIMKNYVNRLVAEMVVKTGIFNEKLKNKLKDEAIKYIGGVVIGLIVIGALILMFRTKIIQGLEAKITEIFNIK